MYQSFHICKYDMSRGVELGFTSARTADPDKGRYCREPRDSVPGADPASAGPGNVRREELMS